MEMQYKFLNLYKECVEELNSININVEKNRFIDLKINTRSKKRYGCCKKVSKDRFQIEISDWVMDLNDIIIKNTIIHELIHCMPRCNNHGEIFKKYARVVNEKLGYNISRVGNKKNDYEKSNKEYTEKQVNYKYKVICDGCNQTFFRQRMKRSFTRKFKCGKCGGKFKIILL